MVLFPGRTRRNKNAQAAANLQTSPKTGSDQRLLTAHRAGRVLRTRPLVRDRAGEKSRSHRGDANRRRPAAGGRAPPGGEGQGRLGEGGREPRSRGNAGRPRFEDVVPDLRDGAGLRLRGLGRPCADAGRIRPVAGARRVPEGAVGHEGAQKHRKNVGLRLVLLLNHQHLGILRLTRSPFSSVVTIGLMTTKVKTVLRALQRHHRLPDAGAAPLEAIVAGSHPVGPSAPHGGHLHAECRRADARNLRGARSTSAAALPSRLPGTDASRHHAEALRQEGPVRRHPQEEGVHLRRCQGRIADVLLRPLIGLTVLGSAALCARAVLTKELATRRETGLLRRKTKQDENLGYRLWVSGRLRLRAKVRLRRRKRVLHLRS